MLTRRMPNDGVPVIIESKMPASVSNLLNCSHAPRSYGASENGAENLVSRCNHAYNGECVGSLTGLKTRLRKRPSDRSVRFWPRWFFRPARPFSSLHGCGESPRLDSSKSTCEVYQQLLADTLKIVMTSPTNVKQPHIDMFKASQSDHLTADFRPSKIERTLTYSSTSGQCNPAPWPMIL